MGADFDHRTLCNDNTICYINVDFHYLSNETNQRFVSITILELQAKTS